MLKRWTCLGIPFSWRNICIAEIPMNASSKVHKSLIWTGLTKYQCIIVDMTTIFQYQTNHRNLVSPFFRLSKAPKKIHPLQTNSQCKKCTTCFFPTKFSFNIFSTSPPLPVSAAVPCASLPAAGAAAATASIPAISPAAPRPRPKPKATPRAAPRPKPLLRAKFSNA